jgi:hypothetical protein
MSANTQLGSVEEACMKLRQLTDTETRDGFAAPSIARLGTINTDGSPPVTAVSCLPEADGTLPTNMAGDWLLRACGSTFGCGLSAGIDLGKLER